jgi:hypothetical protein
VVSTRRANAGIVWVSVPGDYATSNSNHTPDGTDGSRPGFVVDLRAGAKEAGLPEADCVVSLSSQAAWYTFAMRFGLPTLGVSGRFKIKHSEPAFAALKKLGAVYSSGFYTKKAPRFGIGWRL